MPDNAATPTTESTKEEGAARPLSLLAQETFGNEFVGEVTAPEEDKTKGAAEEGADTEATTSEEAQEETEASESTEAGEEEVTVKGEEETPAPSIEHFEFDTDWSEIRVPVKVDGKPAEATISDLVRSYQIGEAAEKRLDEAKTKAKALTDELAQKHQSLEGHFATAAELIKNAEKVLDRDTANIDWKALRQDDPAEYSAKKAEIAERRQEVERLKQSAVESYQTALTQNQQEAQQRLQAHLVEQRNALLTALPEWKDEATAKAERTELVSYLKSNLGFEEQDIMSATDHRLVVMARKAMLYDKGKAKVDVAKKKLAKVPKVMKPGAPKPQDQINRERIGKVKANLQKTGSLDAAYELLKAQRGN